MLKKTSIVVIFIITILSLILSNYQGNSEEKTFAVINNKKVILDIADNDEKRATGLMYRESIENNQGMLFLFDYADRYNFWMKNVKIPLDIVYLYNNKIVKIYNEVPICKIEPCEIYPSDYKVNSVIELKGGFCKKNKIKTGMSVTIKNLPK